MGQAFDSGLRFRPSIQIVDSDRRFRPQGSGPPRHLDEEVYARGIEEEVEVVGAET